MNHWPRKGGCLGRTRGEAARVVDRTHGMTFSLAKGVEFIEKPYHGCTGDRISGIRIGFWSGF